MTDRPFLPQPTQPPAAAAPARPASRQLRVEYAGFQDVEEHREFRFRIYGRDASREFRVRIASAAFDSRRISMQDCPDLCYQALLRAVSDDLMAAAEVMTIGDADLASYREDHATRARKRTRPAGGSKPAPAAAAAPRKVWQSRSPSQTPPAPTVVAEPPAPAFAQGQRVRHAVFGLGVTKVADTTRTVIAFDEGGPRSFVTSMLELELLSPPGAWETTRNGSNRPRTPPVG